jgi:hypothetical protein
MNPYVFGIGIAYWLLETKNFGWNWSPQSPEEIICDGIVAAIMAMAFIGKQS